MRMSSAQRVLYDQLNTYYCDEGISAYIYFCSSQSPRSPYGPLALNPFSRALEEEASKNFINELQQA
jgi:hypothetical protein